MDLPLSVAVFEKKFGFPALAVSFDKKVSVGNWTSGCVRYRTAIRPLLKYSIQHLAQSVVESQVGKEIHRRQRLLIAKIQNVLAASNHANCLSRFGHQAAAEKRKQQIRGVGRCRIGTFASALTAPQCLFA